MAVDWGEGQLLEHYEGDVKTRIPGQILTHIAPPDG